MRGGGSAADLSCFDDYTLCANVAQYPLPVMTAVGHDRDYHVCDMVSAVSVKTPTALADYLLDIYVAQDEMLLSLASRLVMSLRGRMASENARVDSLRRRAASAVRARFAAECARVDMLEMRCRRNNPQELMKCGYSLVRKDGQVLSSVRDVAVGDEAEVMLRDGVLRCKVLGKQFI